MRIKLRARALSVASAAVAAVAVAACSVSPGIDGGIVGTGNRVDCEPQTKKDGSPIPLPEQCKARSATPR